MRVAVCEDDRDLCHRVAAMLRGCGPEHGIQRVDTFYSGDQFWFEFQATPHPYDLIVLDIEFPGEMNGLDVGRYIRTVDEDVTIVILTAFRKYSIEGYDVLPYRYLVKPVQRAQLLQAVDYARERMKQTWNDYLNLYCQAGLERILLADILYLESRGHNVYIHVEGEEQPRKYYRKLSEVAELCDRRFIYTHKSYMVNAEKIQNISGSQSVVLLKNGKEIPISKQKKATFIREVMEYDRSYGIVHA